MPVQKPLRVASEGRHKDARWMHRAALPSRSSESAESAQAPFLQPQRQKQHRRAEIEERPDLESLGQQHEVQGPKQDRRVGQPVELAPALAQAPDRGIVRGQRQRDHQDKGQHPDGDIGALDDVGPDLRRDLNVEHQPDQKMQGDIEEGDQPQRPAEAQQVQTGVTAQGGDRQDQQKDLQPEFAQLVLERADRLDPEPSGEAEVEEPGHRQRCGHVEEPGRQAPTYAVDPIHHGSETL